jgi:hypothetical protein
MFAIIVVSMIVSAAVMRRMIAGRSADAIRIAAAKMIQTCRVNRNR